MITVDMADVDSKVAFAQRFMPELFEGKTVASQRFSKIEDVSDDPSKYIGIPINEPITVIIENNYLGASSGVVVIKLVNNFPILFEGLVSGPDFSQKWVPVDYVSTIPVITEPLVEGQTEVDGSETGDGDTIEVFVNGVSLGTMIQDGFNFIFVTDALVTGDVYKARSLSYIAGSVWSEFSEEITVLEKTDAPVVDSPISEQALAITGTSTEADGTDITVYANNSVIGSTLVASGVWSLTITDILGVGDPVKAIAQADGKAVSDFSNIVLALEVTDPPSIDPAADGDTHVSGSFGGPDGATIEVFVDGVSKGTTIFAQPGWDKTGLTPLVAGQSITATATEVGKFVSALTTPVIVGP